MHSKARELGLGLGMFHNLISDLPADQLHDTLPGFHIAPSYLKQYRHALSEAGSPEGSEEAFCREFVLHRHELASILEDARERGGFSRVPFMVIPR